MTTNDLNGALEEFEKNGIIREFADRNKHKTINPYVMVEGDPTVYRLGEYLSSIGIDNRKRWQGARHSLPFSPLQQSDMLICRCPVYSANSGKLNAPFL